MLGECDRRISIDTESGTLLDQHGDGMGLSRRHSSEDLLQRAAQASRCGAVDSIRQRRLRCVQ